MDSGRRDCVMVSPSEDSVVAVVIGLLIAKLSTRWASVDADPGRVTCPVFIDVCGCLEPSFWQKKDFFAIAFQAPNESPKVLSAF